MTECLQTELEEPFRFTFCTGNESYGILVESMGEDVGVNIGCKPVLIIAGCHLVDQTGVVGSAVGFFFIVF